MEQHHVHFEATDVAAHENSIVVNQTEAGKIDIHVGFLQVLHRYEVNVAVPAAFLPPSDIVPKETDMPNLVARILSMKPHDTDANFVLFQFEVTPPKEKLYHERIVLLNAHDETQCEITLHCRVLGKGKGTPMLKNGIRTIELLPDPDETEGNSDWQGF